jgi:hypothetical protein
MYLLVPAHLSGLTYTVHIESCAHMMYSQVLRDSIIQDNSGLPDSVSFIGGGGGGAAQNKVSKRIAAVAGGPGKIFRLVSNL